MQRAIDVDGYIAVAPESTRPILIELRRIFRKASPKLEETIKWNVPCYVYKGPVGAFTAYAKHVSWGLWKAALLNDPDGIIGQGILKGGKITSVADIPSESKMIRLIRQAIALNEAGIKPTTPEPDLPPEFAAAMENDPGALEHFAAFTPARRWQYVNWISKAKRTETRTKRIAMALELISAGKKLK